MLGKGNGGLYKAPTMKDEENERLRGERDRIKIIGLRFGRGQVVDSGNDEEGRMFHILHVLGND